MALALFIALIGMFLVGFIAGYAEKWMRVELAKIEAEWDEFDRRMAEDA